MWKQTNYLETKLKEYFKKTYKKRERDKLSASDTGCMLHRELKLWGVDTDTELTFDNMLVFDFGNMVHWFLQQRLQDADILEVKELELEDELTIGHADALVRENGKLVPYEFKSIKDYGLDRIEAEGKPQESHIKQLVGGYMRLLRKLDIKNLAGYGKIVYLAKCFDDSHRKFIYKNKPLGEGKTILRFVEYQGDYDEEIAKEVEAEAVKVRKATDEMEPLACSEWDKVYHRDEKWNQYLSWCKADVDTNRDRIMKLKGVSNEPS